MPHQHDPSVIDSYFKVWNEKNVPTSNDTETIPSGITAIGKVNMGRFLTLLNLQGWFPFYNSHSSRVLNGYQTNN